MRDHVFFQEWTSPASDLAATCRAAHAAWAAWLARPAYGAGVARHEENRIELTGVRGEKASDSWQDAWYCTKSAARPAVDSCPLS